MITSVGIFKFGFALISGLLLAEVLSPRPALAIHGGKGCVFTMNIPDMAIYPLIQRLRGDDDIDGSATTITIDTLIEQPSWKQGEQPKPLQLDVTLRVSEIGGDGTVYAGGKALEIKDKWILG